MAARLGLTAAQSPYVDPDPELAELLVAGQQAGQARIEELVGSGGGDAAGWTSAIHMFDYNLDHLSLGTIDAPDLSTENSTVRDEMDGWGPTSP